MQHLHIHLSSLELIYIHQIANIAYTSDITCVTYSPSWKISLISLINTFDLDRAALSHLSAAAASSSSSKSLSIQTQLISNFFLLFFVSLFLISYISSRLAKPKLWHTSIWVPITAPSC